MPWPKAVVTNVVQSIDKLSFEIKFAINKKRDGYIYKEKGNRP